MAWDQKILPDAFLTTALAAVTAASNGSKDNAFMQHIQSGIGTSWKRQFLRNDIIVFEGTGSGLIPFTGRQFTIPSVTKNTITSADINTGEWIHRIISTVDATKYISSLVTPSAGTGPGFLSGSLLSPNDVIWASFVVNGPQFDTNNQPGGELTLSQAYATCMTSPNDFPPGNSGGSPDFVNSLWPRSTYFFNSPYGSNTDPMIFGQEEPGVGRTDAGYIVTQRAATGRAGDRFSLWQWVMGPKGVLNAPGNWRVQIRDIQAALKIDSLSNPWQFIYGPGQIPSYGLNNLGGLRISGIIDDFQNSSFFGGPVRRLFEMNANPTETRLEASGGISLKNFTTSTTDFQVELNSNDPLTTLTASQTPSRVIAFSAVYWARLIPSTGTGPIPEGLSVGAMHGIDFYDNSGRVGTPGQSRLVKLDATWKPIVVAFVLTALPPSQPMTPAQVGTWLSANPPPFV